MKSSMQIILPLELQRLQSPEKDSIKTQERFHSVLRQLILQIVR